MEPKPIFVIRLSGTTSPEARARIFTTMNLEMPDLFNEYHVIFCSGENKHMEFECYNIKDIPEHIRTKTNGLIMDIIAKQL